MTSFKPKYKLLNSNILAFSHCYSIKSNKTMQDWSVTFLIKHDINKLQ